MKNKFIIENVYAKGNKIFYKNFVEGKEKFGGLEEQFSVEYNENIENIQKSILVILLVCNVLPITWLDNDKYT